MRSSIFDVDEKSTSSVISAAPPAIIITAIIPAVIPTSFLVDLLVLVGADEIILPSNFKGYVFYIGSHGDKNVSFSDLILPSTLFCEKKSLFLNTEGRVQLGQKAVDLGGYIRDD